MKKDLLKMDDLSKEEILEILNIADQLKYELKHNMPHEHLKGKTLGMIFEKRSTRTRVSFETGMYQLGGNALFLSARDLQAERGEAVEDTARVLSRFLQGIMIRTFSQEEVETFAKYATVPVINGLTDTEHPCQVLADLMTIREYKNILDGLNIAYIGDGHNMCNSLIIGCLKVGMNLSIACPEGYHPSDSYINRGKEIAKKENVTFNVYSSPEEAVKNAMKKIKGAYALVVSSPRKKAFKNFQVNNTLLELAKPNALVLHCLPAHRGEEISAETFEEHSVEIFDESENRLHVQKAVLLKLMKNN